MDKGPHCNRNRGPGVATVGDVELIRQGRGATIVDSTGSLTTGQGRHDR